MERLCARRSEVRSIPSATSRRTSSRSRGRSATGARLVTSWQPLISKRRSRFSSAIALRSAIGMSLSHRRSRWPRFRIGSRLVICGVRPSIRSFRGQLRERAEIRQPAALLYLQVVEPWNVSIIRPNPSEPNLAPMSDRASSLVKACKTLTSVNPGQPKSHSPRSESCAVIGEKSLTFSSPEIPKYFSFAKRERKLISEAELRGYK